MVKKLIKLVLPFFFVLLILTLGSCLTIDATIDLSEDLSGSILYKASISTLAADLEEIDKDKELIPFPLLKEAVDKSIEELDGISAKNWSVSDDGTRYQVDGLLDFTDLTSLSSFSGMEFTAERSGNNTVLSVSLFSSLDRDVSSSVQGIVDNNFANDYIEIKTLIPGSIIRVEGATFSGSTVTFRRSVSQLLASPEDARFTVEYR